MIFLFINSKNPKQFWEMTCKFPKPNKPIRKAGLRNRLKKVE
jgi:hypothetical protein